MSTTNFLRGRDAVFRYTPHHQVDDSLRLGWLPTEILRGTVHDPWSIMMAWLACHCGRRMPIPRDAA